LGFCGDLYKIEKELVEISPEKRCEERLLRSKPVLKAFMVWLKDIKEKIRPNNSAFTTK